MKYSIIVLLFFTSACSVVTLKTPSSSALAFGSCAKVNIADASAAACTFRDEH